MPRRKNVIDAAIKQLSPVLGSEAVFVVAALGLAALVTEVLVTVAVVVVAAAGLTSGRAQFPNQALPQQDRRWRQARGHHSALGAHRSPLPAAWHHRARSPHAWP